MNLKDWEKLSPEEQQRRLDEKPIEQGKCAAGLLELRNNLKGQIDEERDAAKKYMEQAERLGNLDVSVRARALMNIAEEEMLHNQMLRVLVDDITKECGE